MPTQGYVTQYRGYTLRSPVDFNDYSPLTEPFTYDIHHLREGSNVFRIATIAGTRNPLEQLVRGYRYHRKPSRSYK